MLWIPEPEGGFTFLIPKLRTRWHAEYFLGLWSVFGEAALHGKLCFFTILNNKGFHSAASESSFCHMQVSWHHRGYFLDVCSTSRHYLFCWCYKILILTMSLKKLKKLFWSANLMPPKLPVHSTIFHNHQSSPLRGLEFLNSLGQPCLAVWIVPDTVWLSRSIINFVDENRSSNTWSSVRK
jgi:hypothetical protein